MCFRFRKEWTETFRQAVQNGMTSSAEERTQIMIADGSIGDHAKKTEKEDGESLFWSALDAGQQKSERKRKNNRNNRRLTDAAYQMSGAGKLW